MLWAVGFVPPPRLACQETGLGLPALPRERPRARASRASPVNRLVPGALGSRPGAGRGGSEVGLTGVASVTFAYAPIIRAPTLIPERETESTAMSEAGVAVLQGSFAQPEAVPIPSGPGIPAQRNIGTDLDRLVRLLPAGAAREFVRGIPRRIGRSELLANLEALVRLLQWT